MKWFKNFRIGTKLIITFLVVALICGAVGCVGIMNINAISRADTELYSANVMGITYMNAAAISYQRVRYNLLRLTMLSQDESKQRCYENIKAYSQQLEEYLNKYERLISSAHEQELFDALKDDWEQYVSNIESVFSYIEGGFDAQAASLIISAGTIIGDPMEEIIDELLIINDTDAQQKNNQNVMTAQTSTYIMFGIVLGAFLFASLLGVFISRIISKPITALKSAADKLAMGDINIELSIESKDEVGKLALAFKKMMGALCNLIDDTNMLAVAAMDGRLSVRADESKHQGDYKMIVKGINKTLDAVVAPVKEASEVLAEVAKGNISLTIMSRFNGDHAIMKESINETVTALKGYIQEISLVLHEIENGNLTTQITSNYLGDFIALKDSINAIISSLNDTLLEINISADQVASGSQQVSGGSQIISQGTVEQASALEEFTGSAAGIAAQTRENAQKAGKANELFANAKAAAANGNAQMIVLQSAMTNIHEASNNISKIIKVIDGIAFQTNILALNAAVEAARAGSHGKGFAVVAEEVRNLAGHSADAAKETKGLIEDSIKMVETGTRIADKTALALKTITDGIEEIAGLLSGIASASSDQATAITQMNSGIEQLSAVVQTNSATAEETAAASEELSNQAAMLKNMVNKFELASLADQEVVIELSETNAGVYPQECDRQDSLGHDNFGKY